MGKRRRKRKTYIPPQHGAKTRDPHDPRSTHGISPQSLAAKDRFAYRLALHILDHALGRRKPRIPTHPPGLTPIEAQRNDIAQGMRREQQLPRPGVRRLRDRAACQQFLEVEFDGAGNGDGGGHADHDAGTDDEGAIDGELEGEEGVRAAVGDAVGAAVEGAHVVGGGGRGDGLCC